MIPGLCLAAMPGLLQAQMTDTGFEIYDVADGLSDNTIKAITQDRFGYIWIGTAFGLNRFDGLNVLQFHSDPSETSLPHEDVISLQWAEPDLLAVVTEVGISLIDVKTMKQSTLLIPAGPIGDKRKVNRGRGFLRNEEGHWFIATRTGFYHLSRERELLFRYDDYTQDELNQGGSAFGVFLGWLDSNHILLTGQKGVYEYDVKNRAFTQVTGEHPRFRVFGVINRIGLRNFALRQSWPGHFMFIVGKSDTVIYVDEPRNIECYSRLPISPVNKEINWRSRLIIMPDSSMFITGKDHGIFRLLMDKQTGALSIDTSRLLSGHKCNDLFIDRQGTVWAGLNNGLLKEHSSPIRPEYIKPPGNILSDNPVFYVQAITADDMHIYVASGSGKNSLLVFRKTDGRFEREVVFQGDAGKPSGITALKFLNRDTILCGTDNRGLCWYHTGNHTQGNIDLPGWKSTTRINDMIVDKNRGLWVTTNKSEGYYLRRVTMGRFEWCDFREPLIKNLQTVHHIAEDKQGDIWMAGFGICRYSTQKSKFDFYTDSFPFSRFRTRTIDGLTIDPENNIWLANTANGLIRFEPATGKMRAFTVHDGLPDMEIGALLVADGSLWVACRTGIAKMDLKSLKLMIVASRKEMFFRNVSGDRLFHDPMERMIYAGLGDQFVRFSTQKGSSLFPEPRLLIENIILDDSVIWNPPDTFTVSWSRKNMIVTFNSINYHDPSGQQYAYRVLTAGTAGWIELGDRRSVVFNGMSAGTHPVEIRVASSNNRWEPQIIRIVVVVYPPFWKTGWFYSLSILFLGAALYGVFRYRINRIREVLAVRERISQDIHDEVGATLSGISMYSYLTQEQIKARKMDDIQRSVSLIQQASGEMVDKLNDIVWLIKPRNDSLKLLLQRLEEYAVQLAAARNIHVQSRVDPALAMLKISMERRRNIFLIGKEAVNNAVKYSEATIIELDVRQEGGRLELRVSDNGKGFDAGIVKRGNGLDNMQRRAAEIGASLALQTEAGRGTVISLRVQIT